MGAVKNRPVNTRPELPEQPLPCPFCGSSALRCACDAERPLLVCCSMEPEA